MVFWAPHPPHSQLHHPDDSHQVHISAGGAAVQVPLAFQPAGEDWHQDLQASVGAALGTAGPSSTPGRQQGQGALLCLQHCSVCVGRVVHPFYVRLLQVKTLLWTVEEEVFCRSKAVESGWSFADQQSSEGVCLCCSS